VHFDATGVVEELSIDIRIFSCYTDRGEAKSTQERIRIRILVRSHPFEKETGVYRRLRVASRDVIGVKECY